ncbi:unnamed protein product [Alopecurus aequalis]
MRLVDHDAFGAGVVGVWCRPVVLHAAVLELDVWLVARPEEVRVVVRRRRGLADGAPARCAAPGDEEVAGGVAVGDGVVGREPDGERSAREPGELHLHHLLELPLQVRVQLQQQRRGLARQGVGERCAVHACLHEPGAAVVEQNPRRAIRGSSDLAGEEPVHRQHVGEATLNVSGGGRRRREGVDDGHLDVVRDPVEDRGRHVLRRVRTRRALGVPRLHQPRAQDLHLHGR